MDQPSSLGDYIKAARISHGYTVRDMQTRTGLSHTTITRIENGAIVTPTPDALLAIIAALELDPKTVVGYLGSYTRLIQAVLAADNTDDKTTPRKRGTTP